MRFVKDDGGRASLGLGPAKRDCVCRSIAIATKIPYVEVYVKILDAALGETADVRSEPSHGVYQSIISKLLINLGWTLVRTVYPGCKKTIRLETGQLPRGRLIVHVSQHVTAVINGAIHDTYDCSYGGTRCVYGYWKRGV